MRPLSALFIGLTFGIGLCLSGMTLPSKVTGFLDLAGVWDPSLAFVMGGAIAVGVVLFRLARRRLAPPSQRIDRDLLVGSVVFGIGWGLVGYCPGPALAALGSFEPKALVFVAAMIAGTCLKRLVDASRRRAATYALGTDRRPAEAQTCGA